MAFRQHLILKDAAFNFIFDKVCELGCAITEKEREIESLNIDLASLELANDLAPKSKRILKSIYDVEKMKAQLIADVENMRKEYYVYYRVFLDDIEAKGEQSIRANITELTKKEAFLRQDMARLSHIKGKEKEVEHITLLHNFYYQNLESVYYFLDKIRDNDIKKRLTNN